MGISISYRGRLADLTRIEDFEDRLLDLALEPASDPRGRRGTDGEVRYRVTR
jgi:hypothetical protein